MIDAHTIPENDDDLHEYITAYLGFDIPRVAVCESLGHVSPFSVLADLFFHRTPNVIVLANRTGGKTLNLALLHHINSILKAGCETVHLGAIKRQAFKCKEYASDFLRREWYRQDRVSEIKTMLSYTNRSRVEIVTGSASGVNCLVGETLIDVLDAKGKWRLADLVGRENFWVHGYVPELGIFIPGRVRKVWKVGRASVYRLVHDKGELIGTADHPVMLFDGSYKRLADLRPMDRLRPGYCLEIEGGMRNHRVVLVEPYGEADVYDIEVYPTHNFVANGIVVHNSPHPQISSFDEVELMKWTVLQEGFSMAMTRENIPATQILASTRKDQAGNMSDLADRVASDPNFPFVMRSWCIFETLENCNGIVTCDDCKSVVRINTVGEEESWYEFCQGRGKRARGFFSMLDAHTKFVTLDPATFDSQWACVIAGGKGMVFPHYRDAAPHVQRFEPEAAWKIVPIMDFGFDKPGCLLFVGMNPETKDLYVFGEHYQDHLAINPGWDKVVGDKFYEFGIPKGREIRADIRGDSEIRELRNLGYNIRGVSAPVKIGLGRIYVMLSNTVLGHHPAIIIHPECKNLRREIRSLGYRISHDGRPNTDIVVGDDHAVDVLRYALRTFNLLEEHDRPVRIHSTTSQPTPRLQIPTSGWTIPDMRIERPINLGPGLIVPSRTKNRA